MMESEVKDTAMKPTALDTSDWDERTLCSDESCIGVIGPDGRCKECGKAYDGRAAAVVPPPSEPPSAILTADSPDDADDQWERRRLCSDESCIGVIGPDGRCKECGQPFKG